MKFHEYLESQYVSTNLKLHENYHPYLQAKSRAVQKLIDAQRKVYQWGSYAILLCQYAAMKCGLTKAPLPAMEIAKAVNDEKEAQKAMKAKLQEEQKKLDLNHEPVSSQGLPQA